MWGAMRCHGIVELFLVGCSCARADIVARSGQHGVMFHFEAAVHSDLVTGGGVK